jgi:hypothetical protein
MANFILVHSPLLGPLTWRAVAGALRQRGHAADVSPWPKISQMREPLYPSLADTLAMGLGGHEKPQILVAHSGAGALIPEVAKRFIAPIAGVIYADAILPHPGRSWFDTAPEPLRAQLRAGAPFGELPKWDEWWPPGALERLLPDQQQRDALIAELEPPPLAYFEEQAPLTQWNGPTAYLQLSGAYDDEGQYAVRQGWPVVRLPLHHLAMLTHAEAVAGAIHGLAERLPHV